jgi:hypothetical protein
MTLSGQGRSSRHIHRVKYAMVASSSVVPAASCSSILCWTSAGQRLFQSAGLHCEGRQAGAGAGEDQARKTRRLAKGVLHRKHAAPGVAEQVHTIETERTADCADFVDKRVYDPQGRVVGMVGFPAAELVIENDRAPGVCQDREIFQVVVRGSPARRGVRAGAVSRRERKDRPRPGTTCGIPGTARCPRRPTTL